MKKKYIKPYFKVIKIAPQNILVGSDRGPDAMP